MGKLSSCTHKSHIHCGKLVTGNGVHSSDKMTVSLGAEIFGNLFT